MSQGYPIRVYKEIGLVHSSLVVGWNEDVANLGRRVTDYLRKKLRAEEFAEIEPEDFFPLGGVAVRDDLAQFPESKFYVCPESELVIFQSDYPKAEWFKFLDCVIAVAQHYCQLRELYIIGGMVSFSAHTTPRELFAVVNLAEIKEVLSQYGVNRDIDYQTPPGERPTLSSYLLWIAKRYNIPAISLWVPVPFYLVTVEDPQAQKKVLSFLDRKLGLNIDFGDLDQEIRAQNEKIAQVRSHFPQIDDYIRRLESNLLLSEEENGKLIKQIEDFLGEKS